MNKPKHIIIHHSAVKSNNPQFSAVNKYHKSLDFPQSTYKFYIGYHWFIERDGTAIRARADKDEGAHTLGGWNKKSIGICLAGDFSLQTPSEAQIAALRVIINEYSLPYMLHSEADTRRTCPLFRRDWLENKLRWAKDEEDLAKCEAINEELRKENEELKGVIKQLIQWIKSFFPVKK